MTSSTRCRISCGCHYLGYFCKGQIALLRVLNLLRHSDGLIEQLGGRESRALERE
jgi:hypothetical protein